MNVYITNRATAVTDVEVTDALPAFQHHADLVCSAWRLEAVMLVFAYEPPPDSCQVVILDDADRARTLGRLDGDGPYRRESEYPLAKVFARTVIGLGYSWTVVLSHELAEMLVNPSTADALQVDGRFYSKAACDPVMADERGFTLEDGDVLLSNFVYPAWFIRGSSPPYDYAQNVSAPLQVLAGGIAEYFEGGKWHQVQAQRAD